MNRNDIGLPIPCRDFPNAGSVVIAPVEEPLVCISETCREKMVFQPKYWERGVPGAVAKIYVRKTVEEMLLAAANLLPEGYKLKILDAWRPAAVQKALFDEYYSVLQERFQGDKSEDELKEMASQFVSYPSEDPNRPFVHATGGAVDLTIVDAKGKELNMGTAFDDFSDAAHTTYFENTDCTEIRDNRRLLYHVMAGVGFTNYPGEWWHYDFGDRFWAAIAQRDSIYRGIYELPEI